MEKGKFGVTLAFYGVTAFAFAWLGYFTPLVLLAGVVLLVEKNEWATRQVLQAGCLYLASSIINAVLDVFDIIYRIPFLGTVWSGIIGVITWAVSIVILVFAIMGILRTMKGKDANIPLASKFANWAYGMIAVTTTTYQQAPAQQEPAQQSEQQDKQQ